MSEEPKYELMRDTAPPLPYDIVGPREFAQAWVQLLGTQPHVWWLCAERFDDWPFEQPEVADALVAWSKARPQGRVYILAREFAWVERNAARFIYWRRMFAHQVAAKRWPQRLNDEMGIPRGIFSAAHGLELGFHPSGQLIARRTHHASHLAAQGQSLQELWDRSHHALPAHTLGL
jgi:hypothetical protein